MTETRKGFIMLCLKETQQECIDRGLFGEVGRSFANIQDVKPGDVGFLFNMDKNALIGPFEAISEPGFNLVPEAWKGKYPSQVRVKATGPLKRINMASEVLQSIDIEIDELRLNKIQPRFPVHDWDKIKKILVFLESEGIPLSEPDTDSFSNITGSEEIDKLKESLPDGYLQKLNEVALEVQEKVFKLTKKISIKSESGDKKIEKDIPILFNVCILGEVSDKEKIIQKFGKFFTVNGLGANDWDVEFFNNAKIKQGNMLRTLIKGQSKFQLIITAQIHSHTFKGNEKANIISELKDDKYIPHIIGSAPQELLTPDKALQVLEDYLKNL